MSMLAVVAMKPEERTARRLHDEQIHRRVESLVASGVDRRRAFTRTASAMDWKREEAIAAYWRHRRRQGW